MSDFLNKIREQQARILDLFDQMCELRDTTFSDTDVREELTFDQIQSEEDIKNLLKIIHCERQVSQTYRSSVHQLVGMSMQAASTMANFCGAVIDEIENGGPEFDTGEP